MEGKAISFFSFGGPSPLASESFRERKEEEIPPLCFYGNNGLEAKHSTPPSPPGMPLPGNAIVPNWCVYISWSPEAPVSPGSIQICTRGFTGESSHGFWLGDQGEKEG